MKDLDRQRAETAEAIVAAVSARLEQSDWIVSAELKRIIGDLAP